MIFSRLWRALLLAVFAALVAMTVAYAAGSIVLDGAFGDWNGQASISDPHGDAANGPTDIKTFYFATNPGDSNLYFMTERWERAGGTINYSLYLDMDNNGVYTDPGDRFIVVAYKEQKKKSQVDVQLYDGGGGFLATLANNADWGDSEDSGGTRVEWGASMDDLGMVPGQTIRMTLQSSDSDGVSDSTSEVQWSPADALGWPILIVILLAGAIWMAYWRKQHSEKRA
jgi:hypothetical protein